MVCERKKDEHKIFQYIYVEEEFESFYKAAMAAFRKHREQREAEQKNKTQENQDD